MKVLIACEESQEVCKAFRAKGHEAYSCDIQMCSGGHPEWHICNDVLDIINGNTDFFTGDGAVHTVNKWDLLIAHPPCTYLSNVATRHHSLRCTTIDKINIRTLKRIEAMDFFMKFVNADCGKIAIENPVGVMNTAYRKPDCIVQPYQFAANEHDVANYVQKKTCLWLKNLPPLVPTNELPKPNPFGFTKSGKPINFEEAHGKIPGLACDSDSAKARSKTFPAIAHAMAEQWGNIKEDNDDSDERGI